MSKTVQWEAITESPAVRRLLQLARRSFGVALNFVDHRGWLQGIAAGRFFNPANPLSALISASDEGFAVKRDTAFRIAAEVQASRLPKRQMTELGTSLVGVPLIIDGKYVGYIYADDFFEAETLVEQRTRLGSFLRRQLGGEPGLDTKMDEIPVLSGSDVAYLTELMDIVAEEIAGRSALSTPGLVLAAAAESAPGGGRGGTRDARASGVVQIDGFDNSYIVGAAPSTQELVHTLARVASSDATVLVTGESGVGKELVAKTLHENSKRRSNAFIAVNCGAFHEHLLESELFGHVKGAFTGATDNRVGYFERADGGTLFLDEIGETSLATQVKMLRFLQESTYTPVGGNKEKTSKVRVVAATNRDLRQEMRKGRFREDFYYRLKVIQIAVPALRERREDIPTLVDYFLRQHGDAPPLAAQTLALLCDYHWPGNIRQLENEIKRLCVLAKGDREISAAILSPEILSAARKRLEVCQIGDRLKKTVEERERQLIIEGLSRTGGNKSRLAKDLGMSRTVLANKIRRYGIAS